MSLSNFSVGSPLLKKSREEPPYEQMLRQQLPDIGEMSVEYIKKLEKEEKERWTPPKNSLREEEEQQTSIIPFPSVTIPDPLMSAQDQHQLEELKAVLTRKERREERRAKRSLEDHTQDLIPPSTTTEVEVAVIEENKPEEKTADAPEIDGEAVNIKPVSPILSRKRTREVAVKVTQVISKAPKIEEQQQHKPSSDFDLDAFMNAELQKLIVTARCMKCRKEQVMVDCYLDVAQNSGRAMVRGKCSNCEHNLSRFQPKELTAAKKSKLAELQSNSN